MVLIEKPPNNKFIEVYRSKIQKRELNPKFEEIRMSTMEFCKDKYGNPAPLPPFVWSRLFLVKYA